MKTLFKYLFMSISAALCLPVVTACDDEEAVDPYDINYVYIYSPTASDNTLEYKGNGTFLVDVEPHSVINPVRCTKPAPEDLTIQLDINPSLVDVYNQANSTNYTLLKNAQLENATLRIRKGEYISADSLKVQLTDLSEFQNGAENYILPISITSISGSGVSVSETSKIYLTFRSLYKANFVNIRSSEEVNLEFENGGFTNLMERLELENAITSSWAADDDISVSVKIDPGKIETYNALNGTSLELMPNAALEKTTMTIKKGASTFENPLTLFFSDAMASVELGKGYILPLTITDVKGVGAEAGEKLTMYFVVKTLEKTTITIENAPIGNPITDFTNWVVTVNGNSSFAGTPWKSLLTNPGEDYVSSMNYSSVMEIEMVDMVKVSTIQIEYYDGRYYCATSATLEFSADGLNYKSGQCNMAGAKKHNFVLKYPTDTRYIRIKGINSYYGAYPIGIIIYKQDE